MDVEFKLQFAEAAQGLALGPIIVRDFDDFLALFFVAFFFGAFVAGATRSLPLPVLTFHSRVAAK